MPPNTVWLPFISCWSHRLTFSSVQYGTTETSLIISQLIDFHFCLSLCKRFPVKRYSISCLTFLYGKHKCGVQCTATYYVSCNSCGCFSCYCSTIICTINLCTCSTISFKVKDFPDPVTHIYSKFRYVYKNSGVNIVKIRS